MTSTSGKWPTWCKMANLIQNGQLDAKWPTWRKMANLTQNEQLDAKWPIWCKINQLDTKWPTWSKWTTWCKMANLMQDNQLDAKWPTWCKMANSMQNGQLDAKWPTWCTITLHNNKKVKWSRYRPGVAQRVGRGIALLFHDRGTGRGWVVSSTPRPHFTPGKDSVPILQEAGWAPGPVWTGGKSRPHRE